MSNRGVEPRLSGDTFPNMSPDVQVYGQKLGMFSHPRQDHISTLIATEATDNICAQLIGSVPFASAPPKGNEPPSPAQSKTIMAQPHFPEYVYSLSVSSSQGVGLQLR
ncbi:hypothetical protein K438DRAFT_1753250 [Mycena galopus ATCC 62051]|nr:hypothetical protein K438DRAFT_1753250 [Mycena galopus ATCC 62051]